MSLQPMNHILQRLAPVVPEGLDPQSFVREEEVRRLAASWAQLDSLGFEIELGRDLLQVQHPNGHLETVIFFSEDEEEARRELLRMLKKVFGGVKERFFSWFSLPSPLVTQSYHHLRDILSLCQVVRRRTGFTG